MFFPSVCGMFASSYIFSLFQASVFYVVCVIFLFHTWHFKYTILPDVYDVVLYDN